MEDARTSARRILTSRAFVVLVVLLVLVALLGVTLGGDGRDGDADRSLRAVATASTGLARAGENVTFSAEGSRGDIETYRWLFDDGEEANGSEVSHAFSEGGWRNATLVVTDKAGRSVNATVSVGVQPEDMHNTRDLGRMRDVRPLWMHGYGLLGDVGPHISPPTSVLEYHVQGAFGTFIITVEVWIYEGEGYRTVNLHQEERTMTGGDLDFSYTVEPADLPEETALNYSRVHISTMIDQGRWSSSHITVDVVFPFSEDMLGTT